MLVQALEQLIKDKPSEKMISENLIWLYAIMLTATGVKLVLWCYCRSSVNTIVRTYAKVYTSNLQHIKLHICSSCFVILLHYSNWCLPGSLFWCGNKLSWFGCCCSWWYILLVDWPCWSYHPSILHNFQLVRNCARKCRSLSLSLFPTHTKGCSVLLIESHIR